MNDGIDLEGLKEEAKAEFAGVIEDLRKGHPQAAEGAAAAAGAVLGGAASWTALVFAGSSGLSAVGITTGLASVGAIFGGGMVVGIGVLAAPPAALAVCGYAIAKRRRNARLAAALRSAIEKLHGIQERLTANAEYFREELAEIKAYIDNFESQMPRHGERP